MKQWIHLLRLQLDIFGSGNENINSQPKQISRFNMKSKQRERLVLRITLSANFNYELNVEATQSDKSDSR